MQAVVSRYHHTSRREEGTLRTLGGNIPGGGLLIPNHSHFPTSSLSESLAAFREHHSACASRRRPAYIYEASLEAERTELLAKRYSETLKQELQGTTACPGLIPNNPNPHSSSLNVASSSRHGLRDGNDNLSRSSLSSSSASIVSSLSHAAVPPPPLLPLGHTKTETTAHLSSSIASSSLSSPTLLTNSVSEMSQSAVCPKLSTFSPTSTSGKPSLLFTEAAASHSAPPTSHDEAVCSVVVKTEPGLAGNDCSLKKATPNSCSGGESRKEGVAKTGRIRRLSKELLKNLQQTTPTSCSNDTSGDGDLSLNAYDVMNGKMCTTPLLIPIEEAEDSTPKTTPTLKSPPVVPKRSTKTPPNCNKVGGAFGSDTILKKELDAFSKVMNLVEKQEKAREMRVVSPFVSPVVAPSSLPLSSPYPPLGGPPHNNNNATHHHIVSPPPPPPPYSVASSFSTGGPPYLTRHCSAPYGNYAANSPDTTPYALEPRPLQHLPSSTLSQIGSLLSSPVSTSPPQAQPPLTNHMSSFEFPAHPPPPPGYHHHGNGMFPSQMYSSPPQPHPPHQSGNVLWNGFSVVAGQKRSLPHVVGGDYATPPKMTHCPSSSMISYPLAPTSLQAPCPQFPPGEPSSFSHLS